MRLFYNPDCSKSNAALDILKDQGQEFSVILYCENPPTEADLRELISMLDAPVEELVRTKEELYQEKYGDVELETETVVKILVEEPRLMQRPILIVNNKAIIARPTSKVRDILSNL